MQLAVWAATQQQARSAISHLGLPERDVVAVGNRSSVRGLTLDAVLVLPGARSDTVESDLRISVLSAGQRQWLDLRPR